MSEDGAFLIDGIQVASTKMCPHCGAHFEMVRGSGTRRTWCMRCSAVTCGKSACDQCIPLDARFEHSAGKKTLYDDKIRELIQSGAQLL